MVRWNGDDDRVPARHSITWEEWQAAHVGSGTAAGLQGEPFTSLQVQDGKATVDVCSMLRIYAAYCTLSLSGIRSVMQRQITPISCHGQCMLGQVPFVFLHATRPEMH